MQTRTGDPRDLTGRGPRPSPAALREVEGRRDVEDEMIVSFPEFVFKEFLAALGVLIFLLVISVFVNAPLLQIANPSQTPNPSKAPWYFLGLQELLSRFPPVMAGVAFPTFVIIGMILTPYLDRNPSRRPSERKLAIVLFTAYLIFAVAFVIIGTFFRGRAWTWFWWNFGG